MNAYVQKVVDDVKREYPWQKEYIQAVEEVLDSISIIFDKHPEYEKMGVLERLVTPDRIISFKVPVEMDDGHVEVYHGYRVQQSNLNGPYKGGLRLNPTVNESIVKFLAFEQVFKNALTTCPMGGGKGSRGSQTETSRSAARVDRGRCRNQPLPSSSAVYRKAAPCDFAV